MNAKASGMQDNSTSLLNELREYASALVDATVSKYWHEIVHQYF